MTATKAPLSAHIPYLRRYTRALAGSKPKADRLVRAFLWTLLENGPSECARASRVDLFRRFHATLSLALGRSRANGADGFEAILRTLPDPERQAVLLVGLEEFTLGDAARILDLGEADVSRLFERACDALAEACPLAVLIIEDDYVQARHIAGIASRAGLAVAGMAATVRQATDLADANRPALVIADIRLEGAESGFEAVRRIRDRHDVPVIFVTAYPELIEPRALPPRAHRLDKPFTSDDLAGLILRARENSDHHVR